MKLIDTFAKRFTLNNSPSFTSATPLVFAIAGIVLLGAGINHSSAQTFSNLTPITIPNSTFVQGPASPYPSAINVSGVGNQLVSVSREVGEFLAFGPSRCGRFWLGPQGQNVLLILMLQILFSHWSHLYLQQYCRDQHAQRGPAYVWYFCADEF